MPASEPNNIESLVELSRRQLWTAVTIILVLGIFGISRLLRPDSEFSQAAGKLSTFYPVMIVIVGATLRAAGKRTAASRAAMTAIRNDELRQASLARAFRNGFMALLLLQPLLAVALTWKSAPNPVAVMACASAVAGALVFLLSLLYYDR